METFGSGGGQLNWVPDEYKAKAKTAKLSHHQ
jgi:hypothetical protein